MTRKLICPSALALAALIVMPDLAQAQDMSPLRPTGRVGASAAERKAATQHAKPARAAQPVTSAPAKPVKLINAADQKTADTHGEILVPSAPTATIAAAVAGADTKPGMTCIAGCD